MQYFKHTAIWLLAVCLWVTLAATQQTQADPTDDFSFALGGGQTPSSYYLMPESKVAAVLRDRLDLYPRSETHKLARHILSLCRKYKFDPAFILSIIQVESGFHVKAHSPMGAMGLMQLMPATAEVIATRDHIQYSGARALFDPFTNLNLGVAYLAMLRDKYRGRSSSAYYVMAAYNMGPARMDSLLLKKSFKPTQTKKYFETIERGVPNMRFYYARSEAKDDV